MKRTKIICAFTPPGTYWNIISISSSPLRPRNASENAWALIRMKNTMALMRRVPWTVSMITFLVSRLPRKAMRMLPRPPMDAASVGAATPPMMEPSTAKMRKIGGRTTTNSFLISSRPDIRARSSAGIAGAISGLSQPTSNM